jgi:hypothetical protein
VARIQVNEVKVVDLHNEGFTYLFRKLAISEGIVVDIPNGEFTYLNRPSGNVFIMIDSFMNPMGEWRGTFPLESGKEYYFFITPNLDKVLAASFSGMMSAAVEQGGPFNAHLITKEVALEKLKTMNLTSKSPQ